MPLICKKVCKWIKKEFTKNFVYVMINLSKVFKRIHEDDKTYAYAYIKQTFDTKGHHSDGLFGFPETSDRYRIKNKHKT